MRAGWLLALALMGCDRDETLWAYGAADKIWHLHALNDQGFGASASLRFDANGAVTGEAPCNRFTTTQTAPYPWFDLAPIASTKRACPALAEEAAFFAALGSMTLSEVAGDVLILSNTQGATMLFKAQPQ